WDMFRVRVMVFVVTTVPAVPVAVKVTWDVTGVVEPPPPDMDPPPQPARPATRTNRQSNASLRLRAKSMRPVRLPGHQKARASKGLGVGLLCACCTVVLI